jgi:hypothetical protein
MKSIHTTSIRDNTVSTDNSLSLPKQEQKPQKKVIFNEIVKGHPVLPISKCTEDEVRACWHTSSELKIIRADCLITMAFMTIIPAGTHQ